MKYQQVFKNVLTLFIIHAFLGSLLPMPLLGFGKSNKNVGKAENAVSKADSINRQKNPLSGENLHRTASRSVFFEENRGQHHEKVKFTSRRGRETLYLTSTEAVYMLPITAETEKKDFGKFDFFGETTLEKKFAELNKKPFDEKELLKERSQARKFVPLKMKIIGANPNARMKGVEETPTKINYFKGNDSSKHRTDIPTFGRVVAENIYQGIGLEWYGTAEGEYEYDFKVKPNADFQQIELEFEGASKLETDEAGNLLIFTKAGILRQNKPYSYQNVNNEQKEITSRFEVKSGNKVSFAVENYDKTKELTIDPTLVYSTYIGGSGYNPRITPREGGDYFGAMDVDAQGHAVISSHTYSVDYPVTAGSYDTTINGESDIVVSKLSQDGRTLVFSTFIGGEDDDFRDGSLRIDSQGNICVFGNTRSKMFPVTPQAFQRILNGGIYRKSGFSPDDCVVFKLVPQGNELRFSTFFGGWTDTVIGGYELAGDMYLDSADNIYITGQTESVHFPVSPNAYQRQLTHPAHFDAFVAMLNSTGSQMLFSSYFGGIFGETPEGIAVDAGGSVYVAGNTNSYDFPTTLGAFDRTYNPPLNSWQKDGFVTKFNSDASALVYSTYIGGSGNHFIRDIKVDNAGQAYIVGDTSSTNFPVTSDAYSTTPAVGSVILTKLNQNGSALLYSTYFPVGGSDLILENNGNLIVAGYAGSNSIFTPNAFDRSPDNSDSGLVRFNPSTNQILYATAFGGKMGDPTFGGGYGDGAGSVAMDAAGNIYIAGGTGTTDLPTTEGAFDRTWNGYTDNFVAKFSFAPNAITNLSGRTRHRLISLQPSKGISRIRIKLTDNQTGEVRYQMTRPTGRYEFRNLPANRNYTIEVSDKRRFTNPSETIQNAEGDIGGIDFVLAP